RVPYTTLFRSCPAPPHRTPLVDHDEYGIFHRRAAGDRARRPVRATYRCGSAPDFVPDFPHRMTGVAGHSMHARGGSAQSTRPRKAPVPPPPWRINRRNPMLANTAGLCTDAVRGPEGHRCTAIPVEPDRATARTAPLGEEGTRWESGTAPQR